MKVPYRPMTTGMKSSVRNQIPSGSVLSVVRENGFPDGKGTGIAVSHMGFAIRKKGILYYRNASTTQKKVIDQPLTNYLEKYLKSKTIRGNTVIQVRQEAR